MPWEPWSLAEAAANAIGARTGVAGHDVLVVLGSGWAGAVDGFGATVAELATDELPGFAPVAVAGHVGRLRSVVTERGTRVLALLGRVHGYEGHGPDEVVHAVRSAVLAGCRTVVLTNAAGGVRDALRVGQPVLIADHLNLTGASPLTGLGGSAPAGSSRFVDLTDAYSPRLRALARAVDPSLEEGVYAGLPGPQYETPSEIRMLRALGADLVGMSTVLETIAARHLGAEVLGLSLVSNLAAGVGGSALDHADVLAAGTAAAGELGDLLVRIVARL